MVRGDSIRAFERAFAAVVGVHHAISFAAARVGFFGLLGALGIDEGDEVLLPVPTHVVVPNAVRYRGARPVFVDCDPRTCNIDLADAERRITARTRALVVQHTFGVPVDIERAQDLADRHGLALFEDCVHALGATYRGKPVGSFGRAAFFSTEETKVISTVMGGVVVTDDVAIAKYMREFQERCVWPSASLTARYILKLVVYHVLSYPFVHRLGRGLYDLFGRRNPLPRATTPEEARGLRPLRYELRLSNAQAAVGLEQLRRLGRNLAHRRAIADLYVRLLRGRGVLDVISTAHEPAFVRFPVLVRDRERAAAAAAPSAVLGTWFTSVLEEAADAELIGYELGSCPNAEELARRLVNLPTHGRVRPSDARAVVEALTAHLDVPPQL
jgi:perosamine synthetase